MMYVYFGMQGDAESDADSDNGDSDNDGFFVEHGYLSESEDLMDEDEVSLNKWKPLTVFLKVTQRR